MKINPVLLKLSVKYGEIGAVLAALAFTTFFYIDLEPWRNLLSFILDSILISVFVFLAIRDFKINYNQNELRFYHGMTLGIGTYLMAAFGFAIFHSVFMFIIEPEFLSLYIETAKEEMINRQAMWVESFGQESFDERFLSIDEQSVLDVVYTTFLKKLPVGLLITPVFSVILRTRQSN